MALTRFGHDQPIASALLELKQIAKRWEAESPNDRLRQLREESAEYLWGLVIAHGPRLALEIGGGSGVSTIWIASALRMCSGHLVSIEPDGDRRALARRMVSSAGLQSIVRIIASVPDSKALRRMVVKGLAFVFLDCWKQDYLRFAEMLLPFMGPGSLLVADNVLSHRDKLSEFLKLLAGLDGEKRTASGIVPVGDGLSITRVLSTFSRAALRHPNELEV